MKILDPAPFYVRAALRRIREDRRGPWLILKLADRLGLLKGRASPFPLPLGETVVLPYSWLGRDVAFRFAGYETDAIAAMAEAISAMPQAATFIDCGADVGVYTRLLLERTKNIARIVAFEPNPESEELLRLNLARGGVPAEVHVEGVSDYRGFASLVNEDANAHAAHIRRAESGTPVRRIDDLGIAPGGCLALKLDVEGEELNALRGADFALRNAKHLAVQFEAHRGVAARTGVDPIECARLLATIRPSRFAMFEERTRTRVEGLDLNRPFFGQVPDFKVFDVLAVSI